MTAEARSDIVLPAERCGRNAIANKDPLNLAIRLGGPKSRRCVWLPALLSWSQACTAKQQAGTHEGKSRE